MTFLVCDKDDPAGEGGITVYVLSVFHQAVSIRKDSMEELFTWLHEKTNAPSLRHALVIIFNLPGGMTEDELERAKLAKKLYSCCCDGKIKPDVDIFGLYEDIAALRQGGLLA